MKFSKKKKVLASILGLCLIVLATIGITYAWYSNVKFGIKEHAITTGAITFHYQEAQQGLTLNDAMPMTDSQGIEQDNYFDFTITSKTMETIDIPYYITAVRSGTGTNMDNIVKIYLTKVDNNDVETPIEVVSGKIVAKVSELGSYINNQGLNIQATEKALYNDKVWAGTNNYVQKYRLRMWISDDAQFIIQQEGQPDIYPYQGKTYTLKVNVYSIGINIGKSAADLRNNIEINSINIGNTILTTNTDNFIGEIELPPGETSTIKSITVDTTNPNSTVQIIRNHQANIDKKSNIKRLSTSQEFLISLGINNYTINIKSENGRIDHTYHLSIIAKIPEYIVTLSGNNMIFPSNTTKVQYNGTSTITISPSAGYYLNGVSCTNGYDITAETGIDAIGEQNAIIANNGAIEYSVCTFNTTPITYLISYNNVSDSLLPTNYNIETETFNLPTPTKVNYTFEGWYENSDFNGNKINQITHGSIGNKIYYAKWSLNKYKVRYNANGGNGTMEDQLFEVETQQNLALNNFKRPGYVFKGWAIANNSTTPVYADGQSVINLSTTANDIVNLYAVWEETLAGHLKMLSASSTVLDNDGTVDSNMRFIGASPDNYITFNNETWRIIGVFNIKSSVEGEKELRVKIVRNGFFSSEMAWNSSGNNNWPNASINTYINNWLSASAKTFVDDAYWNLGGYDTPSITASQMYQYEHNGTVYPTNATYWIGKVGLMYASDYGFASSECYSNTNLISFNNSTCLNSNWIATSNGGRWESLLTHHTQVRGSVYYIYQKPRGSIDYNTNQNVTNGDYMRPVVYLKTNVLINSGTGKSTSPYTIKLSS